MKYTVKEVPIKELIDLIDKDLIDLKPSYQRNFIWSPADQKYLIDSILKGFPLPNFFLYHKSDGKYEMVDGQQRARTIFRFWKGIITTSQKQTINDVDNNHFLNYKLNWSIINEIDKSDSLEEFYVLVNKRSKHLTTPEIYKAQFHDTRFLSLVEDLLDLQEMINLNLFSEATTKRMNDRSFVEELVAYLKVGITDKKQIIEKIFEIDISEQEYEELKQKFINTISKIDTLNKYKTINLTRYKQKNDFYTLFNFTHQHIDIDDEVFLHQYKILLLLEPHIRPSNEECKPLKEYALHCVSQSNSKYARLMRLEFFNDVLCNAELEDNKRLPEILDYLETFTDVKDIELVKIGEYQLIDVKLFNF